MVCDHALQLDSLGYEWSGNRPRVQRFSAGKPSDVQIDKADIVTSVITILFGAVHCFAWFFDFPSEAEQLLWRIASVATTASPIIWTILYTLKFLKDTGRDVDLSWDTIDRVGPYVVPFYLVARAMLLVLAFASLRSLTPAAYKTVYWTTFIPHI